MPLGENVGLVARWRVGAINTTKNARCPLGAMSVVQDARYTCKKGRALLKWSILCVIPATLWWASSCLAVFRASSMKANCLIVGSNLGLPYWDEVYSETPGHGHDNEWQTCSAGLHILVLRCTSCQFIMTDQLAPIATLVVLPAQQPDAI